MEPRGARARHNRMLADTSDIHVFSTAQHRHADDLAAVAADLTAAQSSADAFGAVGAAFLTTLNAALVEEAGRVRWLAERLATARSTAATAADTYRDAEATAGQAISMHTV